MRSNVVILPHDSLFYSRIDIRELLVANPARTYLVMVLGDTLEDEKIHGGDFLAVERDVPPAPGRLMVAETQAGVILRVFPDEAFGADATFLGAATHLLGNVDDYQD